MHRLSVMRLAGKVRSHVGRRLSSEHRNRETGTVAVIVGIILANGVLLGLGALVLDTGSLLSERRQLQNGADAAALSLAKTCAQADEAHALSSASPVCATPDTSASSDLAGLAGKNAADKKSDVASVCGSKALTDVSSTFAHCIDWTAAPATADPGLVECPKTASTAKYVEVRTSTRSGDGLSPILPPILAQTLAGGYTGETVRACSRVGWGKLGGIDNGFPLVLGACAWNAATNFGTRFATPPSPQYTPAPNQTGTGAGTTPLPAASLVPLNTLTAITAHTSSGINGAYNCAAPDPAGKTYPGGFGWATTCGDAGTCSPGQSPCSADFVDTGTVIQSPGSNGAPAPSGCRQGGLKPYVGTVVYVPTFTIVSGTSYTIDGIAAFYLAGYSNVPAGGPKDMDGYSKALAPPCDPAGVDGANTTCLWGWFTAPLAPVGSISTTASTARGPLVVAVLG